MKVKDLVALLQTLDQERNVYIGGYEGGVDDYAQETLVLTRIQRDVNDKWYYGKHEATRDENKFDDEGYVL